MIKNALDFEKKEKKREKTDSVLVKEIFALDTSSRVGMVCKFSKGKEFNENKQANTDSLCICDITSFLFANWKVYEYCFIKQKCQIQMGIAQYKNAATPLRIRGINTTHQHFQMRYITLF